MRAVFYLRQSTDRQETSIRDQRTELEKHAKTNGYTVVGEYVDEGISGDATERRKAFQLMIRDSSKKKFDLVLCWDQDRFGRFDPIEGGFWIKPLRDAGVMLETIAQGRIDWSDFAGRIVWSVTQEAKHAYLRDLARNCVRGVRTAVESGVYLGEAPYGYRKKDKRLILGPEREVAAVRRVFELRCQGFGYRAIGLKMKSEGWPHPRDDWDTGFCRYILRREAYTGCTVIGRQKRGKYETIYEQERRFDGTHDPIISKDTWLKSQTIAKAIKRPRTVRGQVVSPFSGMLICGMCGQPMHSWPYKGQKGYACGTYHRGLGCGWAFIPEATLVAKLIEELGKRTGDEKRLRVAIQKQIDAMSRPVAKDHSKRIAEIDKQIERSAGRLVEVDDELLPRVHAKIRELRLERDSLAAESARPAADIRATAADAATRLADPAKLALESPEFLRAVVVEMLASPIVAEISLSRVSEKRKFYRVDGYVFPEPAAPDGL